MTNEAKFIIGIIVYLVMIVVTAAISIYEYASRTGVNFNFEEESWIFPNSIFWPVGLTLLIIDCIVLKANNAGRKRYRERINRKGDQ